MRHTLAAILLAGSALPALAGTLAPVAGLDDAGFDALCGSAGNVAACERGVAEIRGGNGAANGDLEYTIRQGFDGFAGPAGQLAIMPGSAFDFLIDYDGMGLLSFTVDGNTAQTQAVDFSAVNALYVRTSNSDGSFSLTNLVLNGMATGDITASGKAYSVSTDLDFQSAFTISGTSNFADGIINSGPNKNNGSRLATQFKFVEVAPIPVPAAGILLVAALGGLGAMRRAKRT